MGTNYNPCAVTDGLKLYLDAQNVNSYPGTGTTRFRIVRELNESGGFELWSVDRNGYVTQTAWAPGEVIKTTLGVQPIKLITESISEIM